MLPVFSKSAQAIFAAPFSVFLSRIPVPPTHSLRGVKGFYTDYETGSTRILENAPTTPLKVGNGAKTARSGSPFARPKRRRRVIDLRRARKLPRRERTDAYVTKGNTDKGQRCALKGVEGL